MNFNPNRYVGRESRKSYAQRCANGFWRRYIGDSVAVLDIGYRGGEPDALPIVGTALGLEPGEPIFKGGPVFDGKAIPFCDGFADVVHASHVLEHVENSILALTEWFRVLRIGGYLILFVPHAYLYERRISVPPSRWSPEHLRSFTPASLMQTVECALPKNCYRVRLLRDEDDGYRYDLPSNVHPVGQFEITLVLQKIAAPSWSVEA